MKTKIPKEFIEKLKEEMNLYDGSICIGCKKINEIIDKLVKEFEGFEENICECGHEYVYHNLDHLPEEVCGVKLSNGKKCPCKKFKKKEDNI